MATPQSTTSDDLSGPKKLEQITFRFCSECSNMLYPKEDEDAHKLQFTCRTCQYTEDAQSTCVFRNVLNNSSGETAGVTQDVGSDPTVSTSDFAPVLCLSCEAVIYCNVCGVAANGAARVSPSPNESEDYDDYWPGDAWTMGLCQFNLLLPDDPFEEYDEEMMDDAELSSSDDSSEAEYQHPFRSEVGHCEDGAILVNL
ncbi:hypothetical protein TrVFT333_004763 [Trichoderma virens FT-333]|jgi:DNA-directed RNA polymerase II subunit RPB9|nr:hypothetical protein TrVFT333_004763 [Trichoderma virens FT-333]